MRSYYSPVTGCSELRKRKGKDTDYKGGVPFPIRGHLHFTRDLGFPPPPPSVMATLRYMAFLCNALAVACPGDIVVCEALFRFTAAMVEIIRVLQSQCLCCHKDQADPLISPALVPLDIGKKNSMRASSLSCFLLCLAMFVLYGPNLLYIKT